MTVAPMGSEKGTYVGMVIGYWEQACALLNYGLLHEELFFETSGEFFMIWELLKPTVPEFRKRFNDPNMLSNLEKVAERYEQWYEKRAPGHIALMRQMMQQEQSQAASSSTT